MDPNGEYSMNDPRRRDNMNDRTKANLCSGIRIPFHQGRLASAAELLEMVLGDVEGMYLSADDMGDPFLTQGGVSLGTDLNSSLGELEHAIVSLGRARAFLENCTVLSSLDGNPV